MSEAIPIKSLSNFTDEGTSALLARMLEIGRKVSRPALFCFKMFMDIFASRSESQIIFCKLPPSAVSIATSRPSGTSISSPTTPRMPFTRDFIMYLTP